MTKCSVTIFKAAALFSFFGAVAVSCGRNAGDGGAFVVSPSAAIDGLHAPWDCLDDRTLFRCFSDGESFYFSYEVTDTTPTYAENFTGEATVENEDRAEIFFSPKRSMDDYYCAEIDPLGRVLDYSGHYYRDIDYGWGFRTMRLVGQLTENGYIVAGKVSKDELRKLGCDLENGFWMGVFRADYHTDMTVNWYSAVSTDDISPDFHKPEVLFFTKIR